MKYSNILIDGCSLAKHEKDKRKIVSIIKTEINILSHFNFRVGIFFHEIYKEKPSRQGYFKAFNYSIN